MTTNDYAERLRRAYVDPPVCLDASPRYRAALAAPPRPSLAMHDLLAHAAALGIAAGVQRAFAQAQAPKAAPDAIAEWEGELTKRQAAGMTRLQAVSTLYHERRDLVVRYNEAMRLARRK